MDMQVVVNLLFDKVAHIFINGITIWRHNRRTQLNLCLTLEDRFFHIDGNGCDDTCTDVAILVFTKKLLDGSCDMLLKGTLMGTTLCGVLAIDERVIFLAILVGMCKGYLDIVALQMDNRIEGVVRHTVLQ